MSIGFFTFLLASLDHEEGGVFQRFGAVKDVFLVPEVKVAELGSTRLLLRLESCFRKRSGKER